MAQIPKTILDKNPPLRGLKLLGRGKVRDTYDLPDHPDKMLVVASDRISIFDFVLAAMIPCKGAVLTALNHFWTEQVLGAICETDMIACGAAIDQYLPTLLRGNVDLQTRATVVKKLCPPQVEDVVRLYLTGSGWKDYQQTGTVYGHRVPPGLQDGNLLPYALFTPTTKSSDGHDEPISADEVVRRYGFRRERLALQCAQAIAAYAERRGIIFADTKFEFSELGGGGLILADEKGTPDSSRFWDRAEWEKAQAKGKLPSAFDKQYARNWGIGEGVNKLKPDVPEDLARVHSLEMPANVCDMTTRIYRAILWRLSGLRLEVYQRSRMGIDCSVPRRRVTVLVGSKSDLPQAEIGLSWLKASADTRVMVVSCHRNPDVLCDLARTRFHGSDVVIAGAGKAAALPGIAKSWLCQFGFPQIPVIGVGFEGNTTEDNRAAIDSIECLPGQPVELDPEGHTYFGPEGFVQACEAAVQAEFLPKTIERKPTEVIAEFPS